MASPVPPSSVGDPEVVPEVIQTARMAHAPLSPNDSDLTLPESEFDHLYRYIATNQVYHS